MRSDIGSSSTGCPPKFFDAHNHIHMSVPGKIPTFDTTLLLNPMGGKVVKEAKSSIHNHASTVADFFSCGAEAESHWGGNDKFGMKGMALMSTQPRDFAAVDAVSDEFKHRHDDESCASFPIVCCYGVHPWFLHKAEADGVAFDKHADGGSFWWEHYLRRSLANCPSACVGEIGLDSARYDPATRKPHTPMNRQVEAFELQLRIATELQRPVSIHAVQAWGPLLETLNKKFGKKKGDKPPRMYFHAFGGKPAVVSQIDAACRGADEVIYGFAPIINFRSPKTAEVIRKIGIDRLVLESDREDYRPVPDDLAANAKYIAEALGMDQSEVINRTSENAMRFYGLDN